MKIEDTFGERIGMSRRDVRRMSQSRISREDFERLDKNDRKVLGAILERDALWREPEMEYGPDSPDYEQRLIHDLLLLTIRRSLPSKCPEELEPEKYAELVLMTRDLAEHIFAKSGNYKALLEEFQIASPSWPYSLHTPRKLVQNFYRLDHFFANAATLGFPAFRHPDIFNRNVFFKKENGVFQYRNFSKGVRKEFATLDEMKDWLAAGGKKKQGQKQKIETPVRPMLENLTRKGLDNKVSDIMPNTLRERYNFRGGEFGTWLSQEDRRQSLEWAANAFSDLARVLDINEEDIGANSLAFAFGARGTGGSKAAAAHYEPLLNVINLTKMYGAGSTAHEWGHYFDNRVLGGENYLEYGSSDFSWLKYRTPKNEADSLRARREKFAENESAILSWTRAKRPEFEERIENCATTTEYIEVMKEAIQDHVAIRNMKTANQALRLLSSMVEWPRDENLTLKRDFYRDALFLDKGRSKKYWSTAHEMFARVFEKFVLMKLEEKGWHNDYLVTLYEHPSLRMYPDDEEMRDMMPHIEEILKNCGFAPRVDAETKEIMDEAEKLRERLAPPLAKEGHKVVQQMSLL